MSDGDLSERLNEVAIIGMAGRFPQARDVDEFWRNLRDGVESVSFFSDEDLEAAGVERAVFSAANYVKAGVVLDGIELFDASFFGFTPREAELIDPQQRFFLECAWGALECAGYDAEGYDGRIGVYAGGGINTYLLFNLASHRELLESADRLQIMLGNDKDYLATRVSYKLNLTGPSVTVQTACSTSLVAVHLACQSLLNGECDMALAGGVAIRVPHRAGYLYQEGGIVSPDGHCRAFDAQAQGTIFGNGVGLVVLKRLIDALRDRDCIHAVIKGSAINNDGALKVGYTAPSVRGQVEVIAEALAVAGVEAETISYIEAHGTGTALGDPVEIAAATQAFRAHTAAKNFCAIGSVKTNVGHLDTAAGIAGLIKTVQALKHKSLPPSLHFEQSNPKIDFADSPFYVNDKLAEWKSRRAPLRAGVSSFGIGGTNAHVIVEEAPRVEADEKSRPAHLLTLSAKTASALEQATGNLLTHLKLNPHLTLADVAYTLQIGRRAFNHRRMLVCHSLKDAIAALEAQDARRVFTSGPETAERPLAFMFTGQGSQYVNMGAELYGVEPAFGEQVDLCVELLKPHLGFDLREVLFPRAEKMAAAERRLNETWVTQPALFVVEYALAKLFMRWGVRPQAMIGHSIGEYVAACLAGVFALEDALRLVAARGRLMQRLPGGAMLAVFLSAEEAQALLNAQGKALSGQSLDDIPELAAVNAPALCVLSGTFQAIARLEHQLAEKGVGYRRLKTSHAFHSKMMTPAVDEFVRQFETVKLTPPQIPYLSNVTGAWITDAEATDPAYWGRHLRQPVLFAQGVGELLHEPQQILLEVGPGPVLAAAARQHPRKTDAHVFLTSLRRAHDEQSDVAFSLDTLGRLWLAGREINWASLYTEQRRRRLPLPTYPFERQRYWIEPLKAANEGTERHASLSKRADVAEWFYVPSWKRSDTPQLLKHPHALARKERYLLFLDECGLWTRLATTLKEAGYAVTTVGAAEQFARVTNCSYTIAPDQRDHYDALMEDLRARDEMPQRIVHLWSVTPDKETQLSGKLTDEIQARGFYSLLYLAQALGRGNVVGALHICAVTNELQEVIGGETLRPEKATILGPCRVIPQEYPNVSCSCVDVIWPAPGTAGEKRLVGQLINEVTVPPTDFAVAYRGAHRWTQTFEPVRLDDVLANNVPFREEGVYLITGGMGGIGLACAEYLAQKMRAKLILTGRSPFPLKEEWAGWLATHGEASETGRKIRALQELESFGAEILTASADVSQPGQMREVISQSYARFGALHGVIHAAGVPAGGVMQLKEAETAAKVLAPKVAGTLVLDALLQDKELDFFVLCSSINSITGGFGQVDYCAANAFLDAYAHARNQRGSALTVSINWDMWRDVGMALKSARRPEAISANEEGHTSNIKHPLLDQCAVDTQERKIFLTEFSAAKHWVLDEHRILDGDGVIPGTTYVEMVGAAFAEHAGAKTFEMLDVLFVTPLRVRNQETSEVQVVMEAGADVWNFRVENRTKTDGGTSAQVHAIGKIRELEEDSAKKHDVAGALKQDGLREIIVAEADWEIIKAKGFGARWHNVRKVHAGANEVITLLELPAEFSDDLQQFRLHPALLDMALGFARLYLGGDEDYLPLSYKCLKFRAPLAGRLYSHAHAEDNHSQGETITYNVTITDEHGQVLVEVEAFTAKRVRGPKLNAGARAPVQYFNPQDKRIASDGTQTGALKFSVLQEALKEAIGTEEGLDALKRILSSRAAPQVAVVTKDLSALIEQAKSFVPTRIVEESETQSSSRPSYPRPRIQTPFIAPRSELEESVAGLWRELLGVESVGVNDNFFELGGDSVLAIQIISRAQQAGLRLTPQQLFEHPTVAELAAVAGVAQPAQVDFSNESSSRQDKDAAISAPADFPLSGLDEQELGQLSKLLDEIDGAEATDIFS